jgi:hemerythrin
MGRLEWDHHLETGFKEIDDQHRRIILRLSVLLEALEEGSSYEIISEMAAFLVDYTSRHFSTEEAIMLAMSYPEYEGHKKKHDEFITEMKGIAQAFEEKKQPLLLLVRLGTKVVTWIQNHITTDDAEMAKWFREQRHTDSAG